MLNKFDDQVPGFQTVSWMDLLAIVAAEQITASKSTVSVQITAGLISKKY